MRLLATVSLLVIAIVGCQPTEPTSQDRTATAGTYVLRTLNDTAPPYVVLRGNTYAIEILYDTLALAADGSYRGLARYKRTNTDLTSSFASDTVKGTWLILGSTVSFKASTGDQSQATSTVNSTKLTVAGGGIVSVYSK